MSRNRTLSLVVVAALLLSASGYLLWKADQKHTQGGLNPAVFAAANAEDSLEVYEQYQDFLASRGFVSNRDDTLFESFPRKIYSNSRQDRYVQDGGREKLILQIDVSENGFFPHLKWDARGLGSDATSAEKKGLAFAIDSSQWMGDFSDKNQVGPGGWAEVKDEYATEMKKLSSL